MARLRVRRRQLCPAWGADQRSASSTSEPGGTVYAPPYPLDGARTTARRNGRYEWQANRPPVASGVTGRRVPSAWREPATGLDVPPLPPPRVYAGGPAAGDCAVAGHA